MITRFAPRILFGLMLALPMFAACDPPGQASPASGKEPPAGAEPLAVSPKETIRQSLALKITVVQKTLGAEGRIAGLAIAYEIRNGGPAPVTFHLDGCGICFWSATKAFAPPSMFLCG